MSSLNQDQINAFWVSFTVDKEGNTYRKLPDGSTVAYKDFKYLKKDGQNYLLQNSTGKLYDNELNYYYYQGKKYDFNGNLIDEVDKDKAIDTDNQSDTFKPNEPPEDKLEVYDSEDNFTGYKDKNPKVSEPEELLSEPEPIPEPKSEETPKKEPETKKTEEKVAEKVTKSTEKESKMVTKSLGGTGHKAIGLGIALAIGFTTGAVISKEKKKHRHKKRKKQEKKQQLQQSQENSQYIDNQYAMQMAQDISSYRYGKHMTGFVNQ